MHQKKAFNEKKDGSGLSGLILHPITAGRALSNPASGSSPAGAEVWAQDGAQLASVITMPYSDKTKRLVEEASFHGPAKLKVALSLRKQNIGQVQDKHL